MPEARGASSAWHDAGGELAFHVATQPWFPLGSRWRRGDPHPFAGQVLLNFLLHEPIAYICFCNTVIFILFLLLLYPLGPVCLGR